LSSPRLTPRVPRAHRSYAHAPELNDVLHLHCKGIAEITNLEEYTGLKTLYLESNSVDDLEGLLHLDRLRCLYIAKNCLRDLDRAARLVALTTLDVSDNQIVTLEGLRDHPSLSTLVAVNNKLREVSAIEALGSCVQLVTVDLSRNKLEDRAVVDFFLSPAMSDRIRLLKLQGNPAVSEVPSYRKTLVSGMKRLNYLDDSPVFPKDKRLAAAWLRGGVEEEKAERARIFEDERRERERHRAAFDDMVANARREAEEKERAGIRTKRDPYRFMSEEAAEEARMLADGMTEWELEEMRANEQLPWQVRERERTLSAKTEADRAPNRAERPDEDDEDDEEEGDGVAEVGPPEHVADDDGDERIPVAIPIDDDRPTPGIFVAQVDDDDDPAAPASAPPPPPAPTSTTTTSTKTTTTMTDEDREASEASAAEELRRELEKMRAARRGDRHEVVDGATRRRKELERAADSANRSGGRGSGSQRSPVVFGTRAYDQLWAQAKAMGDADGDNGEEVREDDEDSLDKESFKESFKDEDGVQNELDADGANSVNSESVDGTSNYSYGDKENRWERASMASVGATVASTEAGELDGIDEFDETEDETENTEDTEDTDEVNSTDGDDPLDRYTVSTVASGKETGKETGDDGRAANDDELWGLD